MTRLYTSATLPWAMQIWTKLTLGFALTAITVVGAYGAYQLAQERLDLRRAAEGDLRLVGAALQAALANSLGNKATADVREILDVVKRRDPSVDVLLLDPAGAVTAGFWSNSEQDGTVRRLVLDAQTASRSLVRFEGPDGLLYVMGAFPIRDDDGSNLGTLALIRSLEGLREDLSSETRTTVASLVTLVVGLAGAGWLLALVYVRRPLLALVGALRGVRSGDLAAKAAAGRPDEIGLAVTEFNALVDDLAEARERLTAEAEAREAMEASLRRADKLVTVGQVSAGLAHEIGSPLQILNGRARALAARAELPADVRPIAQILMNESDRITRIVEQLLTFSRYSAPCMTEVNLETPVRDIVEFFGSEARRQEVRLEFEGDTSLAVATVDIGQIQQVVMNLLSNALRATKRGGRVHVMLNGSSFVVDGDKWRPSISLVVEDTGDGIREDVLPHIFEPFFTTRAEVGGTGLGLAVVKSIIDLHVGAIAVTTRPGEGTRFTVHFPVSNSALATGAVA